MGDEDKYALTLRKMKHKQALQEKIREINRKIRILRCKDCFLPLTFFLLLCNLCVVIIFAVDLRSCGDDAHCLGRTEMVDCYRNYCGEKWARFIGSMISLFGLCGVLVAGGCFLKLEYVDGRLRLRQDELARLQEEFNREFGNDNDGDDQHDGAASSSQPHSDDVV
jgi:hypothetical protein